MTNFNALERLATRRILPIACATALAAAFTVSLAQPAHAGTATIDPPNAPPNIQITEPGNHVFFVGHGVGTQNYVCLPSGSGFKFTLFTPQATLFNDDFDKALTTHYFSPNPDEGGTIRVTWQDSQDTSTVWGEVKQGDSSTDTAFVDKNAVAWLKVTVRGREQGPDGGDRLTKTTFIQRVHTSGGVAPADECTSPADVGKEKFEPYTADYFFYTDR